MYTHLHTHFTHMYMHTHTNTNFPDKSDFKKSGASGL